MRVPDKEGRALKSAVQLQREAALVAVAFFSSGPGGTAAQRAAIANSIGAVPSAVVEWPEDATVAVPGRAAPVSVGELVTRALLALAAWLWRRRHYAPAVYASVLVLALGAAGNRWCADALVRAVQAALAAKFEGLRERSRIHALLEDILPGLDGIEPELPPQQMMHCAVEANVRWTMRQIVESPEWRARLAEDQFMLVGAVCDIATGRVRLLPALTG